MSRDLSIAVHMGVDASMADLLRDIDVAYRRALKSEPGERTEIASYEALCSALEVRALAALLEGSATSAETTASQHDRPPFTQNHEDVVIQIVAPLEPGPKNATALRLPAPEPAESVEIRDDIRGRQLVLERFRAQLDKAITEPGSGRGSGMCPSGVHNRVLTEVLREYVESNGRQEIDVPVVYRDGSKSSVNFPLRCLEFMSSTMTDSEVLDAGVVILRLALLSIRHTEMDAVVDGAWLRNAEVSKPRTAAQTDDYVYAASIKQFQELTGAGTRPVRLYIFQTGLETAVVGFFRALTEFLRDHRGVLEVIPMFYTKQQPGDHDTSQFAGYERGEIWATAANKEATT